MKKTTLIMIASASMLFASPAMNTTQTKSMKCQSIKTKMAQKNKCCNKKMMKRKNAHRKMNSPFLIKNGLPHMNKMIMSHLNNPDFNLTSEQKFQLAKVRKSSMSAIREAKPKVIALRNEIIVGSQTGVSLDKLKAKLAELALLESTATLIHLKCIESTKAILTKDQLFFLLVNKNKNSRYGKQNKNSRYEKQNKRKRCNKRY